MAPIILVSFEDSFEIEEILIRSFGGFRFTSLRVTWLRRPRCTWSILLLTTATRTTLGQNGGTSWWTGNSPGRWWCKQTLLSEVRYKHLNMLTWNLQSRGHNVSFNLYVLEISDEKLELLTYEASHEGMMDSWRERFSPEEHKQIDNILHVSCLC